MQENDEKFLSWIFKSPQESNGLSRESSFAKSDGLKEVLIEVGPRFNFSTAESTNAVGICHSINLKAVKRIETSIRYLIVFECSESQFVVDEVSFQYLNSQIKETNSNFLKIYRTNFLKY